MKTLNRLILLSGVVTFNITTLEAAMPYVTINGTNYWLNGINLPWIRWEDFDDPWGSNNYSHSDFEAAFSKYTQNGINAARVWVHCKGEGSPVFDSEGNVTGPSGVFWNNFADMLSLAGQYNIFIMPALFSFDILDPQRVITTYPYNSETNFANLVASEEKTQTYIDSFLIELLDRFDTVSALLCWEVCNEPEWMSENLGANQDDVIRFNAQIAAAIHRYGSKPVSTGAASPKWYGVQFDWWSDAAMQARYNDPLAYFDIHQIHYYDWMDPSGNDDWGFNPWHHTPDGLGLGDRPVIIGECPGNGGSYRTATEMYEQAFGLGYAGVFAWSDQANDGISTFEQISVATNAFYAAHPEVVEGMPVRIAQKGEASDIGHGKEMTMDIVNGRMSVTATGPVTIKAYSANGRLLCTHHVPLRGDSRSVHFNLSEMALGRGMYLVHLEAGTQKMQRLCHFLR